MHPAIYSTAAAIAGAILPRSIMQRVRAHRSLARGDNPELKLLPRWSHGGSFIDIGANIGDWSRVAAPIFTTSHAFEPIPELALKLRKELPSKVTVYDVALSDTQGSAELFIPFREGGRDTGLASLDPNANPVGPMQRITVPVRTLDSYGFENVDCIKIDVEGREESVLRGAADTIRRDKPVLVVEIEDRHHPGATLQVFALIQSWGYGTHCLMGKELVALNPYVVVDINRPAGAPVNNFVFLPL